MPARHLSLAQALSDLSTGLLGKRRQVTTVMVQELPANQWFVDANPVRRATAFLEISITAGTNTPSEKSAFIAAAFAELEHQLGGEQGLEPASYVVVRELQAADWGYSGATQQARRSAPL